MPCPTGTITHTVQSGDTLYKIAAKYNTSYQAILSSNPGINPNWLYVGQQICIPIAQATLQIATQPVLVNGVDINTGQYPVLNYKPANAQYPYIYVPIAEFSKVGAKVTWDETKQLLSVTTDYYQNQKTIVDLKAKIAELEAKIFSDFTLVVTSISGDLSNEEKMEIFGLAGTKTLDELEAMSSEAYEELNEFAISKGGVIDGGSGYTGFTIAFYKNNVWMGRMVVVLNTNDPKISENYDKYSDKQKEFFLKHLFAAYYVVYKIMKHKISFY
ncbi:hypothetical protein JCM21531_4130 [Acetivibrio straminisolvens JCM 21531]|uniref:LysM domain-containing protein n=2 Tax=Acetivibrio straminisolvens TaxID=253314 RepID=W4VBE1_9FIRM|nr:hypothetical protein JCM21531_4130 [Acetivibrio straminisolvens JCM 21531]